MKTQTSKGGRPALDPSERRSHHVKVGFNEGELAHLQKLTDYLGISVTDFLRMRSLGEELPEPFPQFHREMLIQLANMTKDLDAIEAGQANLDAAFVDRLKPKISEVRAIITSLRDQYLQPVEGLK